MARGRLFFKREYSIKKVHLTSTEVHLTSTIKKHVNSNRQSFISIIDCPTVTSGTHLAQRAAMRMCAQCDWMLIECLSADKNKQIFRTLSFCASYSACKVALGCSWLQIFLQILLRLQFRQNCNIFLIFFFRYLVSSILFFLGYNLGKIVTSCWSFFSGKVTIWAKL